MAIVTGNFNVYYRGGTLKSTEPHSINLSIGDRVIFVDNSYLHNCDKNKKIYYAGTEYGDALHRGVVIAIDSKEKSFSYHTKGSVIEMPIVVKVKNGDIVYCNPLNIKLA